MARSAPWLWSRFYWGSDKRGGQASAFEWVHGQFCRACLPKLRRHLASKGAEAAIFTHYFGAAEFAAMNRGRAPVYYADTDFETHRFQRSREFTMSFAGSARAARQQGALTIAVVTRPFSFEGPQRAASAALGIDNLRKEVDALIVIPNDRLLELADRSIGIVDAFKTADTALLAGVQGITDLITMNSYIHVDFSDVTSILRDSGTAMFGIGSARGDDRATQAAEIAISSPLLEESIDGANGVLINIAASTDLKLQEAYAATELVRRSAHPEAQIIWGLALDDAYGDEIRVTVIAAGFDAKHETTGTTTRDFTNAQSAVQPASQPTRHVEPVKPADKTGTLPRMVTSPAPNATPIFQTTVEPEQPVTPAVPPTPVTPIFDPSIEPDRYAPNDPDDGIVIPDFLR
ncbi:cell division protein FtsZ [uncultured Bifidobacterium sp.]|uniref:cell division protein FtsZ n=1 Tax=uncultured Bifidobacterium sp. TaxID=165187 RepID=UPI002595700F|nr:cell division protein FtsZ [uncultured Bifidobacterium sp.]